VAADANAWNSRQYFLTIKIFIMKISNQSTLDKFVCFKLPAGQDITITGGNSEGAEQAEIVIVDTITT